MPDMGRGITAPASGANIITGAAEMQTLGSTTATAISDLEAATGAELAGKASTGYVDAGLAGATSYTSAVESSSLARDDALAADIAGMEGMDYVGAWEPGYVYRINDVVTHGGDSWARLTAGGTGEPGVSSSHWGLVARKGDGGGFGELTETSVPGLWEGTDVGIEARLAAIEYDSGWRNVTASITATPAPTAGTILVRRVGKHVYLQVNGIVFADSTTSFITLSNSLIPAGLRPPRTVDFASGRRLVGDTGGSIRVDSNGRGILYQVAGGYPVLGTGSWVTDETPPTTPPGTPA